MKKVLAMVLALCMVLTASMAMAEKVEFFQQKMEEGPQKAYAEVLALFNESTRTSKSKSIPFPMRAPF